MRIREWLQATQPKIGTILTIDHPVTTEVAMLAGFDWLWIDAEHGRFNEASAATACAITNGRVPTFIRVPDKSDTAIKRYLDAGADGIIIPQVSSLAEARAITRAAVYAPHGERSVGIARAQGYGKSFAASMAERNYAIMVQIETVAGVSAVESIVAEPDIDAVIIGPYDLSSSYGAPGDIGCDRVQGAIATVLRACKAAGKPCGIFAGNSDAARLYVQQGFDLVGLGIDTRILTNAYQSLREATM